MGRVLLLLIGLPVLEIWLLIQVGSAIGAWLTIALLFLTTVAGLLIVRWQGFTTFLRASQRMAQGEAPAKEMLTGLCLALAGVLLLIPGFATDIVGLALLLPPVRHLLIRRWLARASQVQVRTFGHPPNTSSSNNSQNSPENRQGRTLEGDFRREDD